MIRFFIPVSRVSPYYHPSCNNATDVKSGKKSGRVPANRQGAAPASAPARKIDSDSSESLGSGPKSNGTRAWTDSAVEETAFREETDLMLKGSESEGKENEEGLPFARPRGE